MTKKAKISCLVVVAFFGLFLFGTNVRAALLTVTTSQDTDDGVCDGHCSLREAIAVSASGDKIIFARSLRGATIHLERTLLIERSLVDLTIDGPNRRRITLKGNRTFGILNIGGNADAATRVSIDGLIIRDGSEPSGRGGGIYVGGFDYLNLTDSLVTDNHAAIGGGIRVFYGYLELLNTTVANNTSDGVGGAAGIDARHPRYIEIFNSTISGNRALDGPGGVKSDPYSFIVINSTITDNHSSGSGEFAVGGFYSDCCNGFAALFYNSIIALNTGRIPDIKDYASGFSTNFIGIGDGLGFEDGEAGNIVGTSIRPANPRLGPLTDNGRGIPTHSLLPKSRAINAGNNKFLDNWWRDFFRIDQRGAERIFDSTVDMGSIEYGSNQLPITSAVLGKIESSVGRPVSRAVVTLRFPNGETRTAITNPFGYYRFAPVPADAEYSIEVRDKRFTFKPQSLLLEETEEYVDFRAN